MNPEIIALSRAFASRDGAPVLTGVNPLVFTERYFRQCMQCGFCEDACCQYGADVNAVDMERLKPHLAELEPVVGMPAGEFFTGKWDPDIDHPGGQTTRTNVVDGRCVFLNRKNRGCHLHAFALQKGLSPFAVKPMDCHIFPLMFDVGVLVPAYEIGERSLVCQDQGDSLFQGARDTLLYLFGSELLAELDSLETLILNSGT